MDGCVNGHLSDIVAISAGGSYALALTSAGAVLGWGFDNQGQVGNGTRNPAGITLPVPVCAPGSTPDAGSCSAGVLTGVKAISAAFSGTSLALTSSGAVLAWGANSAGQLGNGTDVTGGQSLTPVAPAMPAGTVVSAISSGDLYDMALVGANTTVTGNHPGPLRIGPGATLISGASIDGPVVISPGAAVVVTDSHINGPLRSDGAASLSICDSSSSAPTPVPAQAPRTRRLRSRPTTSTARWFARVTPRRPPTTPRPTHWAALQPASAQGWGRQTSPPKMPPALSQRAGGIGWWPSQLSAVMPTLGRITHVLSRERHLFLPGNPP